MFAFPLDPQDLFTERAAQMNKWGIPRATILRMQDAITDAWSDGPGGWTHEWSKEARSAELEDRWLLAAALYGAARFPVACTESRREALRKQVECYVRASPSFPCAFERLEFSIRTTDGVQHVPAHFFSPLHVSAADKLPVVLLSGGVDTYKMELHRLATLLVKLGGVRVVAIDMPGTGETGGVMSPRSHEVYEGILDNLAPLGSVKRGILGISFGGHWAAKLALRNTVDCAIDIGGPVGYVRIDKEYLAALPNGMTGIVANAMGFSAMPTPEESNAMLQAFSLRPLLEGAVSSPLLALNGAGDPYIPQAETRVFSTVVNARAWIVEKGDHCAANMFPRLMPHLIAWLRLRLHGASIGNRALAWTTRLALPAISPAS